MELIQYSINAIVDYTTDSMEEFLHLCENAIDKITEESTVRFYLKNAAQELVVNSLEHGYNKRSGPIYVLIEKRSESIIFEVADLGQGVDLRQLNLDREVKTFHDLTSRGWGLSILQKVASNLEVSPNQPTGTIISLTMPRL